MKAIGRRTTAARAMISPLFADDFRAQLTCPTSSEQGSPAVQSDCRVSDAESDGNRNARRRCSMLPGNSEPPVLTDGGKHGDYLEQVAAAQCKASQVGLTAIAAAQRKKPIGAQSSRGLISRFILASYALNFTPT